MFSSCVTYLGMQCNERVTTVLPIVCDLEIGVTYYSLKSNEFHSFVSVHLFILMFSLSVLLFRILEVVSCCYHQSLLCMLSSHLPSYALHKSSVGAGFHLFLSVNHNFL